MRAERSEMLRHHVGNTLFIVVDNDISLQLYFSINARAEAEAVGYWYRLPRQTVYHLDRRREACEGILIKRLGK